MAKISLEDNMPAAGATPAHTLEPAVMHEAIDILASTDMSVSDAFTLMMKAIARNKCLPFDIESLEETPNARTQEAMRLAESGEGLYGAKDAKDLFSQLGI